MPYRPDIPQLPPLIRLPRDEVQIREHSPTHLSVALYTRMGSLYRQKVALSDLPNDLIGIEDLERAGVLHVYVAAVQSLRSVEPANTATPTLLATEATARHVSTLDAKVHSGSVTSSMQ